MLSAASVGDFATQLWNIVTDALSNANLALRSALFSAGKVLAAGILCAFASGAQEDPGAKQPAQIAGAFAITALCTRDATVDDCTGARDDYENFGLYGAAASSALVEPCRFRRERERGDAAGRRIVCNESTDKACIRRADSAGVSSIFCWRLPKARQTAADSEKSASFAAGQCRLSVKGLCAVFTAYLSSQPRTDRFCGRDGGEGGAGSVFGDGAGRRVDSLRCVGIFAGKCGAHSQRGRGVRDAGGSWRWRLRRLCGWGHFIWRCGWQGAIGADAVMQGARGA